MKTIVKLEAIFKDESNICKMTRLADGAVHYNRQPNRDAFLKELSNGVSIQPFDLYMTIEGVIEKNDWVINTKRREVFKAVNDTQVEYANKFGEDYKIITTTDPELELSIIPERVIMEYFKSGGSMRNLEAEYDKETGALNITIETDDVESEKNK